MVNNHKRVNVEMTALDRLKQARARLVLRHIFWGTAAMDLTFFEDTTCKTAWTDGKVMGFNPRFINKMYDKNPTILDSVICHEVMHCILLHPLRMKDREFELSNRAMDYTNNGILKRASVHIEPNWLYDNVLSAPDKSTEMVYSILWAKREEEQKQKPKGESESGKGEKEPETGEPDTGENEGDEDQGDNEKPDTSQHKKPQGNKSGGGKLQDNELEEGKNENGKGRDGEEEEIGESESQEKPEPWEVGEVREPKNPDGSSLDESQANQIEQEWKITAQKALQASQECGQTPNGMERIIESMIVVKRDLEEILRDFVVKTLADNYCWTVPNKRMIIHDLYMPSLRGQKIPEIVMVMDTSGSIGDEQLSYFTAKLNSILMEYPTTVHVLYVDAMAHYDKEYNPDDLPITLKPLGGGGTDFRPAFEFLKDHDIEPDCLIYYTDGYCNSFPNEPDYPVLWAIYGDENKIVPFGEVVNIRPEDK